MKSKSILLVEGNPDEAAVASRVFEASKLRNPVVVLHDAHEALDFLFGTGAHAGRDPLDRPQVVLLDLKLPGGDGLEVLRRIRSDERTRLLPVVIFTVSEREQDLVASYRLGANSYIRKPEDAVQLAEAVKVLGSYWLSLNESPYLD